ncbi:DUF2383 domain-containing protein [Tropicimonas sp. S265A]|uniref:DUF2383 domain-containing protein n=1 Tax=Tropicimonas sp. S265A TaxID=3415134 RepID=UPI003C7D1BCF
MPDTYRVNTADAPMAAINKVATDLADVIKGYQVMVERADEDLHPFVERLLALHETHAASVYEMINRMGGKPENAGSFMGLVHEAVATARDWFDGLDSSVLGAIIEGEERIVQTYNDAIACMDGQNDCRAMLEDQRKTLKSHVEALKG